MATKNDVHNNVAVIVYPVTITAMVFWPSLFVAITEWALNT